MRSARAIHTATWIACAALLLTTGASEAGEVMLQRSFWHGWRYSIDGAPFAGIGSLGKHLRAEMEGNVAAQSAMDAYGRKHVWAQVFRSASGGMAVWATIYSVNHEDFDGPAIGLTAGTIGLGIAGSVFENSALNHLLRAVHLHNFGWRGTPSASGGRAGARLTGAPRARTAFGIGLSTTF